MSHSQDAIFTSPAGEENPMNSNHRDSESITDVCSSEDLPEVELVNLLEEQLPQYKLRVDSLFLYENQDWAQSSHQHQPQDAPETLSPVLAEETFRYMILGTDRVEQMTKTYNDIDMVTHLLAERDRDLELAARIGQALLKRNHVLSEQNEALEEQLGQAFDQVNQLQHELSKKDELLRIVSIASEESETDSSCSTPLRFNESFSLSQGLLQLDMLQEKLRELEEENMALRSKACHIKTETFTYEEKEQQLDGGAPATDGDGVSGLHVTAGRRARGDQEGDWLFPQSDHAPVQPVHQPGQRGEWDSQPGRFPEDSRTCH